MSRSTAAKAAAARAAAAAPTFPLTDATFAPTVERVRRLGLLAGAAGLAVSVIGALILPAVFFPAYLAVYLFVAGLGVGSLGLLLLHHLVGGAWGFAIRRPLEAAAGTLPVLALLFLPVVLGMKTLYPWANAEVVKESVAVAEKSGYLNVGFWLARAAGYLLVWSGLALFFRRNSTLQDATADPAPTSRSQTFAAPSLVVLFLTVTFASIDWAMSLEPEWYSTIYGVMVMVGFGLSAMSLAVWVSAQLRDLRGVGELTRPDAFHDLGNLMLAFTMLWAYMSFSQYLIIWMGNLAEEVPWYLRRSAGGWRAVVGALMVFHFFVPFFLLLVRDTKRDASRLLRVAVLLLVLHLVNDVWLVVPAFPARQWATLLAVLPALAGVGGVWLAAYAGLLAARPLVPKNDPALAATLEHLNHGGGGH